MKNTLILIGLALTLAISPLFGTETTMTVQQFPAGYTVASGATKSLLGSATATWEFSGIPAEGDTVTMGTKTYTFHSVLTNADGNVLIGTNSANSATNLMSAISLGAGSGTTYAALMTAHPSVTAAMGSTSNSVLVTALVPGLAGNSIPISDTSANVFPALNQRTLSGGTVADVLVIPINGLGINFAVVATNKTLVNVSNAIASFSLSGDGTNYATSGPGVFSVSVPVNGTTNSVAFTNMPSAVVGNARKCRLVSVNNQDTNSTYITVLGVSATSTFNK